MRAEPKMDTFRMSRYGLNTLAAYRNSSMVRLTTLRSKTSNSSLFVFRAFSSISRYSH